MNVLRKKMKKLKNNYFWMFMYRVFGIRKPMPVLKWDRIIAQVKE